MNVQDQYYQCDLWHSIRVIQPHTYIYTHDTSPHEDIMQSQVYNPQEASGAPHRLCWNTVSVECTNFLTFVLPFFIWWRRRFITTDVYTVWCTEVLWFFVCVYHWLVVMALKSSDINDIYGFILGFMMNKRCRQFLSHFYSLQLSIR